MSNCGELLEMEMERPVVASHDDSELDRYEEELLQDDDLNQYFDQTHNEDQINLRIIQERNENIRSLADEMVLLKEIFVDCANMVFGQGQMLNEAEQNIERSVEHTEEATKSLERAEQYNRHGRGRLFDACVMVAGIGLGSLGWVGGPWIGVPTMAAGLGLSGSVVIARNSIEKATSLSTK